MGSHQGSLLEFTYDNALTGPRHVLVFRTVVKDMSYEVSLNGPEPLFEKDQGVFDDAVDSLVITRRLTWPAGLVGSRSLTTRSHQNSGVELAPTKRAGLASGPR